MSLIKIFDYNNSINFLKKKFGKNYTIFIKDFLEFALEFNALISYCKVDNYAVVNIDTIYNYNDLLLWSQNHSIKMSKFDIKNYVECVDECIENKTII